MPPTVRLVETPVSLFSLIKVPDAAVTVELLLIVAASRVIPPPVLLTTAPTGIFIVVAPLLAVAVTAPAELTTFAKVRVVPEANGVKVTTLPFATTPPTKLPLPAVPVTETV